MTVLLFRLMVTTEVSQLVFVHIAEKKKLSVNMDFETWGMLIKQLEISRGAKNAEEFIKKEGAS